MTKDLGDGRLVQEVSIAEFQAGDINLGNVDVASVGGYAYLGEEAIDMDGSAKPATLPANTNFVEISAEGGDVFFSINANADADSGGYVPENTLRYTLKLSNLTSLSLFGEAGATAHLLYRQEP